MDATGDGVRVLSCGEVRTCLLQTSASLPAASAAQLLQLRPDSGVSLSARPNLHVVSPELLTGVDCLFPAKSGAKVRGVGTVRARAVLTEGRVLQATACFRAPARGPEHRQPWGHYLVRPGIVEPAGRLEEGDAAAGFLDGRAGGVQTLDPGAVAERLIGDLHAHALLDRRAPFKSRRTRLRWSALRGDPGAAPVIERFTLADDGLRTVLLRVPDPDDEGVLGLCEDLALHDWLLTTLVHMVERSRLGSVPGPEAVAALRPAVDHLLHLWMPMVRVAAPLVPLWEVLERTPGFSAQWRILVQRIRDQLALQAIPLLRDDLTRH
ncbi:SCO2521 family protein [Yinghuangia soli]|uniref:SCO2521 family protein n=1 Tax=Yinghuangia soli TaxID=2908204 RepID=A0AA41U0I5_9ACTN|nr:SCO2521 family protein [Yinghuangia soli]MCF2528480.1 SCO2521 family protein [Yinghuangia soli]